jgi:hypothetical protein
MDYRVRGFTRDVNGRKHFIDHNISSIQNYLSRDTKNRYQMIDVNVYQENLFHTKMVVNQFASTTTCSASTACDLSDKEYRTASSGLVRREMMEIFYGRNLSRDIATWSRAATPRPAETQSLPSGPAPTWTLSDPVGPRVITFDTAFIASLTGAGSSAPPAAWATSAWWISSAFICSRMARVR